MTNNIPPFSQRNFDIQHLLDALAVPELLPLSKWSKYFPIVAYIVAQAQPKIVVNLGTYHSEYYSLFCEAILTADTNTQYYAVASWSDKSQKEYPHRSVSDELIALHNTHFKHFASLVEKTSEESLLDFKDHSIDLLTIDRIAEYQNVENNLEQWLGKMSDYGIIILHDTNSQSASHGQLWDTLSDKYPTFQVSHGCGLGIVFVGEKYPNAGIAMLFSPDESDRDGLQTFFEHLGRRWLFESERQESEQTVKALQQQVETYQQRLQKVEVEKAQLEAKLNTYGGKLLYKWWNAKERLLPPDTRRRHIFDKSRTLLMSRLATTAKTEALPNQTHNIHTTETSSSSTLDTTNPDTIYYAHEDYHSGQSPFVHYPSDSQDYAEHIKFIEPDNHTLNQQRQDSSSWDIRPLLSIVTPVYSPSLPIFKDTVASVLSQTYNNFEWIVADASPDDSVWEYIHQIARSDNRIKPTRITQNGGISANTNIAIQSAQGEFIVLLDHDDSLASHALYEVVSCLRQHPDADFMYSDEDKLNEQGYRCQPHFKPDWSPEMMLSINMVTHLAIFRRSLLDSVGYFNPAMDGAQDWDLFLRISEHTNKIYHIPAILYHWRMATNSTAQSLDNKSGTSRVQRQVVADHLIRRGIQNPQVKHLKNDPIFHMYSTVTWTPAIKRKISIIIPSKDKAHYLKQCLDSLFSRTNYTHFEVIIVDTGSEEQTTFDLYETYHDKIQVMNYTADVFNFSGACNLGASIASGDLLLFLNNDVEIIHNGWLDRMIQWFEFEQVGIVGAQLLYPDYSLQHAGIIIGLGGIASHCFMGESPKMGMIFDSPGIYRNFSAVTGACLIIRQDIFTAINGFDESFLLNYSDVDLCIRTHKAGYRIVYTPQAQLIHHENTTHQGHIPRPDFFVAGEKFKDYILNGDPYFNQNLSYHSSMPRMITKPQERPLALYEKFMDVLPDQAIIKYADIPI